MVTKKNRILNGIKDVFNDFKNVALMKDYAIKILIWQVLFFPFIVGYLMEKYPDRESQMLLNVMFGGSIVSFFGYIVFSLLVSLMVGFAKWLVSVRKKQPG